MREQYLAERVEYFRDLQKLIYAEALNEEAASKQNLVRALCKIDPELGEKQVVLLRMLVNLQKEPTRMYDSLQY